MRPVIFYRKSVMDNDELFVAERFFHCITSRLQIRENELVIGRYSMLPFYDEISADILHARARPINSLQAHLYVADLGAYGADLGELVPPMWDDLSRVPVHGGPYVLKGQTNSKKFLWRTHMFAKDWEAARAVYLRLMEDTLVGEQKIYIREYVPLDVLWTNLSGTPITREFRFFVYRGMVLSGGFYWDIYREDLEEEGVKVPSHLEVPDSFLREAIDCVSKKILFFAIDVAQDSTGKWWVIDVNDGQQAGLCGNDAETLYRALYDAVTGEKETA